MRRIALGLAVLVIGGCGGDGSTTSAPPSTAATTTSTPVPAATPAAFPDNVPRVSDGECSEPRTDPNRPTAGPLGKVTDGVSVGPVDVFDGGPDEVVVHFMVSSPPYVTARSGERWVVVSLGGVRRFGNATVRSTHARRLPASVCDDSAWVFALAFDREVSRLTLENERAPTLRVFLKS